MLFFFLIYVIVYVKSKRGGNCLWRKKVLFVIILIVIMVVGISIGVKIYTTANERERIKEAKYWSKRK